MFVRGTEQTHSSRETVRCYQDGHPAQWWHLQRVAGRPRHRLLLRPGQLGGGLAAGILYFAFFLHFCIFANLPTGASMACSWVSVEALERERGREIPAYSIFGRISSPINCILIVRIKANFSVVRGLINFAPEDNGCQEMCRLTKFLEKARHLLAVQPILPKSLRRTLFFREEFLTAPPKHEENLITLSFTLD